MNGEHITIMDVLYEAPGPKTKIKIRIATALSLVLLAALMVLVVYRFYCNGQLAPRYWSLFTRFTTWKFLGKGLWGTIKAALVGGLISMAMGMLLMLGRIGKSKIVSVLCAAWIEFSRGVPTLLFIYFFFLIAPQLGLKLSAFWKITLPVAISSAGVVAEVLRSGVNAVPKGQREAALSLGMRERHVFFKIIFPQAFRYVIPALIAEIVIVLKDTTFSYVVSYADLMQNARVLISNYDALLSLYLVVAVIYIVINYILNKISVKLAHKNNAFASLVK